MDKSSLTERDICTKFILPAVERAGWDRLLQIREQVYFTKRRIIVRGKFVTRGQGKKARRRLLDEALEPDDIKRELEAAE